MAHGGGHRALYAYAHDLPWRGNMRRELLDNSAAVYNLAARYANV
ncbi:MAG: hypothetical protein Q4B27_02845 [Candidatus Saccharibacteria bacterium]|nr:hypothetical protein [Candidatus Saccharibacteria bacterium]